MATEIGSIATGNRLVVHADGTISTGDRALIQRFENNAQGQPVYIGKAVPGTATSAASWQIQKITYSGNYITQINFAGSSADFDQVWDDRTSLSYG